MTRLVDVLNLRPRDSPEDVIEQIRAVASLSSLRVLRPRILRMQAYNTEGYVDCLLEYKDKLTQLKLLGKYNEKTSDTDEEMET